MISSDVITPSNTSGDTNLTTSSTPQSTPPRYFASQNSLASKSSSNNSTQHHDLSIRSKDHIIMESAKKVDEVSQTSDIIGETEPKRPTTRSPTSNNSTNIPKEINHPLLSASSTSNKTATTPNDILHTSTKLPSTAPRPGGAPSETNRQRIKQLFDKLDTQKKGYIDTENLIHALDLIELPARQIYARELLQLIDCNDDQKVDYGEFEKYVLHKEEELQESFQSIDTSSDGKIQWSEMKDALQVAGIKVNDEDVDQFMKSVDVNDDGVISFDEWRDFLLLLPRKSTMKNVYHFHDKMMHCDLGDAPPIPEGMESSSWTNALKYLMAGGVSGAISRTFTAPLDRLRVILQTNSISFAPKPPPPKTSTANASHSKGRLYLQRLHYRISSDLFQVKHTLYHIAKGGITNFWRGNGINILKIIPESAIKFASYEQAKNFLVVYRHSNRQNRASPGEDIDTDNVDGSPSQGGSDIDERCMIPTSQERLFAGAVAGIISQGLIYPVETLKTRVMTQNLTAQRGGAWKVAKDMYRNGRLRSFYRGMGASILGIIPYSSVDLTTYENLKIFLEDWYGEPPSIFQRLACGALSGATGCVVAYPLGLVRTRLQAQASPGHPEIYTGILDVIKKTYKRESIRGFYKGLVPSLLKVVPAVSISYGSYETAKGFLGIE